MAREMKSMEKVGAGCSTVNKKSTNKAPFPGSHTPVMTNSWLQNLTCQNLVNLIRNAD